MQQHSGQHVLSAAFIRLFDMPTVSFHMGDDYCSIDLESPALRAQQVEQAELLANQIVQENRPVEIKFVTQEEAQNLGLRKAPRTDKDELRLIDIQEFDLSACGGTHVRGYRADRLHSVAQDGKSSTGLARGICLRPTRRVNCATRFQHSHGSRRAFFRSYLGCSTTSAEIPRGNPGSAQVERTSSGRAR